MVFFARSGRARGVIAANSPDQAAAELVRKALLERMPLGGYVWLSTAFHGDPHSEPVAVGDIMVGLLRPTGANP